jgi:hypothetical protein
MRSFEKNSSKSVLPAEDIAAEALAWLANDPEMLGRFFALTGVDASGIRKAVNDPGFLIGVLDFIMAHEPTLMAFSEASGIKPDNIATAYRTLNGPGSAEFGW